MAEHQHLQRFQNAGADQVDRIECYGISWRVVSDRYREVGLCRAIPGDAGAEVGWIAGWVLRQGMSAAAPRTLFFQRMGGAVSPGWRRGANVFCPLTRALV